MLYICIISSTVRSNDNREFGTTVTYGIHHFGSIFNIPPCSDWIPPWYLNILQGNFLFLVDDKASGFVSTIWIDNSNAFLAHFGFTTFRWLAAIPTAQSVAHFPVIVCPCRLCSFKLWGYLPNDWWYPSCRIARYALEGFRIIFSSKAGFQLFTTAPAGCQYQRYFLFCQARLCRLWLYNQ
jgi:hypothetical protein